MVKRLSVWMHRISTGWVTLAALVVFLLFTALVLPTQSASSAGTEGAGSPDLAFFYTPAELYGMAEAYGAEGRVAYVRARATFDVVWPLVYLAFLATAISWLSRRAFGSGSWWQRANLVPVLGVLFDLLENVSTSIVMLRYPTRTAVIDLLAPVFTAVKWVFVGGSFVLLLLGILVALWRRARGKGHNA
jgi:hypothetical protein